MTSWQFWIDRGGTFTDIVARAPNGALSIHKLLSQNADRYQDAAIEGIRQILDLPAGAPVPASRVDAIKMGTTVATNALLERKGEPTVLAVTQGLRDVLRIGYQNRPDLFARQIVLPEQLYRSVIEIEERVDADGSVLQELDEPTARDALKAAFAEGYRAIAIVLMHAYRFADHEERLGAMAREIGFTQVSLSHRVSPLMKIVGRGDTTVVDAYLSPVLRRYVDQVAGATPGVRLMFMQSHGGLVDADRFQGKDAILSGPAGGVVGAVKTAALAGYERIVGFDMGGTSTDVTHYAGTLERSFETEVAGARLRAPMMSIHTVAAGGGSIVILERGKLRVGPDSAGADPGPACYRRGGPLTVTDCNLLTGKLQPDFFPNVFGSGGDQALDAAATSSGFDELAEAVRLDTGSERAPEVLAHGALTIANDNMANAIKHISIQRGYDVQRYTMVCFGGAGGQHACAVADALGIERVMIHPFAAVLSAYGIGLADVRTVEQRSVESDLDDDLVADLRQTAKELARSARADLEAQNVADERIVTETRIHVRYAGTDTPIEVPLDGAETVRATFEAEHKSRYGFVVANRGLVVVQIAVEGVGTVEEIDEPESPIVPMLADADIQPIGETSVFTSPAPHAPPGWYTTPIYKRESLEPGDEIEGPALIVGETTTVVVEPEWQAHLSARDHLILHRREKVARAHAVGTECDPIMLEIFNNLFMTVAEQMGTTLQYTAYSVNVRERLDFSCAVFDPEGGLVANAPHIPVHLGSMSESVRTILRLRGQTMKPGDAFALNNPYNGGTHLPDITVIMPVFDKAGRLLFLTGARAHHADVGGRTPGSMPPDSQTIDEEGILFDNFQLLDGGSLREGPLRELLGSGPYPARNPEQNLADLQAQIASCHKGATELQRLVGEFGDDVVQAYMQHVQDNAAEQVRRVLDRLNDGHFSYENDLGHRVVVKVEIDKAERRAVIDFTGTSPQQPNNFNAPAAVCRAAVLYVFRTLVDSDIPLNEGCLRPLDLVMPEGSLVNCKSPAACCAGNVETSQWITDTLYGALGVMAAAQGTMNNVTFGNERYQYYETLCGGSGAGPDFDGTAAVHTNMTNSRLTDPEVLEARYPVRLAYHRIEAGTGGDGRHKGGDGAVRKIVFDEAMEAMILANRRVVPPFGLEGGLPGAVGHQWVERADGSIEPLEGRDRRSLSKGDAFVIQTPGGGGYGEPK